MVISRTFFVPAADLWQNVLSYEALQQVEPRGIDVSAYRDRQVSQGDRLIVPYQLGPLTPFNWVINIVEVDHAAMVIRSEESGGPIRRWSHKISIRDNDDGSCYYRDQGSIDAGIFQPFVAAHARRMYTERQAKRAALLERPAIAAKPRPLRKLPAKA